MALCAYHEDTEAAATCAVCKSPICDKCLEYGADGMCGMCLEMNNARKATIEANRAARQEAAASAGRAAPSPAGAGSAPATGPRGGREPGGAPAAPRPATKPPAGGNGAKPAAKAPSGPLGKGGTGGKGADAAKGTTRGGFCAEHDGQQLTALCTHCRKKVCPYCLDLYDLCVDCRALPHCSRHESMVSQAKCESCQLDYCKLCLDNTAFCDRCRTLGMKKVANAKQAARTPTKPLDPSKAGGKPAGTGSLGTNPEAATTPQVTATSAPAARSPAKPRPQQGPAGERPPARPTVRKGPRPRPLSMVLTGAGVILLCAVVYMVAFTESRPRLTSEEFINGMVDEMGLVQKAAVSIHERTGKWPATADEVKSQLEAQGVKVKKLNPPLSLVVNGPGQEPGTVILNTQGDDIEVRALDAEGRPVADDGRDVVFNREGRADQKDGSRPSDEERRADD